MGKTSFQHKGDNGEKFIRDNIKCPNCGRKLELLPKNYPLYDIQCTACNFRAQIKTSTLASEDIVHGAGWDIMEKVLKAGLQVPQLILNLVNKKGHKVYFFPFIPKRYLKKYQLSKTARRANYKMFNYVHLSELPRFVLFDNSRSIKNESRKRKSN